MREISKWNCKVLLEKHFSGILWRYLGLTETIYTGSRQKGVAAAAKSLQSRLTLCNPMDWSLPGSSVHGILQVRILEWVAFPPPGDLPDHGIEPESLMSPAFVGRFLTTSSTWKAPNTWEDIRELCPLNDKTIFADGKCMML